MKRATFAIIALAIAACTDPPPTAPISPRDAHATHNVTPDPRIACTGYPQPRVWLEAQMWWDEAKALSLPERVGEHVHVGTCWPSKGSPATITGALRLDVRVLAHAGTSSSSRVCIQDFYYSNTGKCATVPVGPGDGEAWVPFDLNMADKVQWPGTGQRLIRLFAEQPATASRPKLIATGGYVLCIRSCSPQHESPFYNFTLVNTTADSYNEPSTYAFFRSPLPVAPVRGLWRFTVLAYQQEAYGGREANENSQANRIFIDPDFHNGSAGTPVQPVPSPGVVQLPPGYPVVREVAVDTRTLSNGQHRLVFLASSTRYAGVMQVNFTVANPSG